MPADSRTVFGWAMYDWANSAYITTLGAVVGAFFTSTIVGADGYWGLSGEALFGLLVGITSLALMLVMPVLGAVADHAGAKRRLLAFSVVVGAGFTLSAAFVPAGSVGMFIFAMVMSQVGFVTGTVLCDAILPEITDDATVDKVSARGYALGYLGGGLYLVIALAMLLAARGDHGPWLTEPVAARAAIFGSGVWWLGFTAFSLNRMGWDSPRVPGSEPSQGLTEYLWIGLMRAGQTAARLRGFPQLLLFVVAYVVYNSGVGTIISVSGSYGQGTLGLSLAGIAGSFLLVQLTAFLGALLFGVLAQHRGAKSAVLIGLAVWLPLPVAASRLPAGDLNAYLVMAAVAGLVLGGVQALSRSLYASMTPPANSGEFFGYYSVLSKVSGIGPLVFGVIAAGTGSARIAIAATSLFFAVGMVLLSLVDVEAARESRARWQ
ncbi:MAG: MFS transporter [Candidatus Nanopelagicales bacterium]